MSTPARSLFSQLAEGFYNRKQEHEEKALAESRSRRDAGTAFVLSALKDPSFKHEYIPQLMGTLGQVFMGDDKKASEALNTIFTQLHQGLPAEGVELTQTSALGSMERLLSSTTSLPMPSQRNPVVNMLDPTGAGPAPTGQPLTVNALSPYSQASASDPRFHPRMLFRNDAEQSQFEAEKAADAAEAAGAKAEAVAKAQYPFKAQLADTQAKARLQGTMAAIDMRFKNRLQYLDQAEQAKHVRRLGELTNLIAAQKGKLEPDEEDRVQAGQKALEELDAKIDAMQNLGAYREQQTKYYGPLSESQIALRHAQVAHLGNLDVQIRSNLAGGQKPPPYLLGLKSRFEGHKNKAFDLATQATRYASSDSARSQALQREADAELERANDALETMQNVFPQWITTNSGGGWPGVRVTPPGGSGGGSGGASGGAVKAFPASRLQDYANRHTKGDLTAAKAELQKAGYTIQ